MQPNTEIPRRILVIQSFEPEYPGYDKIESDLNHLFTSHQITPEIRSFYLDCDSYNDKNEVRRMYNYLDSVSSWNPEIILVYDDQATYTLMACKSPLVKQIPVVFAGVNFPNWDLLKQYPNVTGLWDKTAFMKTIQMVEQIFGPMKINIWMDNTFLGKQTTRNIIQELKEAGITELGNMELIIKNDSLVKISGILNKQNNMFTEKPKETVFYFINARESSSNSLLWRLSGLARFSVYVQCKRDFSSKRLGLFASSPTLTLINEGFGLKEGILGGYITTYEKQLELSVQTAVDILNGKSIKDIPIKETPKEYVIDWTEMHRWNIPRSNIPSDYLIINMPFYERYKTYIISFSIFFGIAIAMLIYYLIHLYYQENRKKQQAQESLKKGERFLSLALAGGKVYAFQLKNNIFSFDKEFYVDAGITEKPLSIEEFRASIHPKNLEIFEYNIRSAREGEVEKNISQIRCKFDNTDYQWWEFRYTYNKEDDTFNGLCLNIQKTKEAEQELINARQRAEESDKMKSAFLANMSHEIRTPLNAIVGFSNIIAEEELELSVEERNSFLTLINSNSELLLKLINDILDLSRIESGKMDFSFAQCNLTDLMINIYHTHQVLMPENVELKIDIPQKPIVIETDPHRLTQVITNFINNAAKFTREGYIRIGYKYDEIGKLVNIYVIDTGIGIPKEKQQAVFERFNKLDEFAQGTGLGLAICQVIVKRFGGKIELHSEKGKGSCFTIALPLHIPV